VEAVPVIHLDTHVVVWLFSHKPGRIPGSVRRRIDAERPVISPMVEVELGFLFEVGRVSGPPSEVLDDLRASLELTVSDAPFAAVARAALALAWTRDPFDRIIAAQSLVDRAPLATADDTILTHLPTAVWD
jgi:PIN domain nuclease of toxin-antitoxin system